MRLTASLQSIYAADPCERGWATLCTALNGKVGRKVPLPFSLLLETNGVDDTIWALRASHQISTDPVGFAQCIATMATSLADHSLSAFREGMRRVAGNDHTSLIQQMSANVNLMQEVTATVGTNLPTHCEVLASPTYEYHDAVQPFYDNDLYNESLNSTPLFRLAGSASLTLRDCAMTVRHAAKNGACVEIDDKLDKLRWEVARPDALRWTACRLWLASRHCQRWLPGESHYIHAHKSFLHDLVTEHCTNPTDVAVSYNPW